MRNMMGLLGNVAEVKKLRFHLMPYIKVFYDLLDSFQDGIEVSNYRFYLFFPLLNNIEFYYIILYRIG